MWEFIGFLKSNWGSSSQASQRLRRLRQLVAMVQGVADAAKGRPAVRRRSFNRWLQLLRKEALRGQAVLDDTSDPSAVVGSAKKFLAGVKALFVCSTEVDRLTDAVDTLERLAGTDLDIFIQLLQLDAAMMDVDDGATARRAKRKRGGSFGVDQACDQCDGVDYDDDVEADPTAGPPQEVSGPGVQAANPIQTADAVGARPFRAGGGGAGQGTPPHWDAEPRAAILADTGGKKAIGPGL
jgi:hypothetical protein